MIKSFGDARTADLFNRVGSAKVRQVPADVISRAESKLDVLDAATSLADLAGVPGNALEKLKGSLKAFHSIRVNQQWRIIFKWESDGAHEVRFTDYH